MDGFRIGHAWVDGGPDPYVIAEIGVNHEGSLDLAKRLVELAREGGADAAKFQSYKAETLASRHSPAYWDTTKEDTRNQYELFKKYDGFGEREYRELAAHCHSVGIDFMATPFDEAAVEFLTPLVRYFKIASADLTNIPLLRQVARRGKSVVLSTGASTLAEIDVAVGELTRGGCPVVALLHCVLNYPTADAHAHLGMITGLRRTYPNSVIGYSDHTVPDPDMLILTTAYLLGASIIEKHFTHDKTLPGNDHYHAMDADDLRRFRGQVARIRAVIGGSDIKQPVDTEAVARANARRSLVVTRDLPAGTVLTGDVLMPKRPGTGISPIHWDEVVGRRTVRALHADDVLRWEDLAAAEEATTA